MPASFFCHGLRFCIVCFVFCHFSLLIKVLFCIFAQMLCEPIGKLRASTHPHYSMTLSMWEKSYKLSSLIKFCVVNTLLWAVFLEKKNYSFEVSCQTTSDSSLLKKKRICVSFHIMSFAQNAVSSHTASIL